MKKRLSLSLLYPFDLWFTFSAIFIYGVLPTIVDNQKFWRKTSIAETVDTELECSFYISTQLKII